MVARIINNICMHLKFICRGGACSSRFVDKIKIVFERDFFSQKYKIYNTNFHSKTEMRVMKYRRKKRYRILQIRVF